LGYAFTSLVTSIIRHVKEKKKLTTGYCDELALYNHCKKAVPLMYRYSKGIEIPELNNSVSRYLATVMSRKEKTVIPVSNADFWTRLSEQPSGIGVIEILSDVIEATRPFPELMLYPFCHIVPDLKMPFVRIINDSNTYSTKATTQIMEKPDASTRASWGSARRRSSGTSTAGAWDRE
jgi:hypothetical protein